MMINNLTKIRLFKMNMQYLVSCFGTSLRGFFEFCEEQNGVKADDLTDLFNKFFDSDADISVAKAPTRTSKKESVVKEELVKAQPKKSARPSGKNTKSREDQNSIGNIDLNKKKLPELKEYARERGLPVSGTKAQLIENILNYEKGQDDFSAEDINNEEEELEQIQVKKPKTKPNKLCTPADRPKYEVEDRHNMKMLFYPKMDGYFVLNDSEVVIGWVHSDDELDVETDDYVDVRALDKERCVLAKELNFKFEVPENLDD
jgi:hypothetical protein